MHYKLKVAIVTMRVHYKFRFNNIYIALEYGATSSDALFRSREKQPTLTYIGEGNS